MKQFEKDAMIKSIGEEATLYYLERELLAQAFIILYDNFNISVEDLFSELDYQDIYINGIDFYNGEANYRIIQSLDIISKSNVAIVKKALELLRGDISLDLLDLKGGGNDANF